MATYTLKSNNVFLRCLDMEGIEVYELDSPYIFPVKGKNWEGLGISIGLENEYEALKIGDKEINGVELQSLIEELFYSRLTVNREGLCFLATAGVTAATLGVEYCRLFDLFDWSKYSVTSPRTTRWVRSGFVDGRPLETARSDNPRDGDVEKKLEKEKGKMQEELKKKDDEIEKLKEELSKKQEEMDKKQDDEINELRRKHEEELGRKTTTINDLEKELRLYSLAKSENNPHGSSTDEFYKKMVKEFHIVVPPSIINSVFSPHGCEYLWPPPDARKSVSTLVPLGPTDPIIEVSVRYNNYPESFPTDFDRNDWKALRVAYKYKPASAHDDDDVLQDIIAYYDPKEYKHYTHFKHLEHGHQFIAKIPIPCSSNHMRFIDYFCLADIFGVGHRVCFYSRWA